MQAGLSNTARFLGPVFSSRLPKTFFPAAVSPVGRRSPVPTSSLRKTPLPLAGSTPFARFLDFVSSLRLSEPS